MNLERKQKGYEKLDTPDFEMNSINQASEVAPIENKSKDDKVVNFVLFTCGALFVLKMIFVAVCICLCSVLVFAILVAAFGAAGIERVIDNHHDDWRYPDCPEAEGVFFFNCINITFVEEHYKYLEFKGINTSPIQCSELVKILNNMPPNWAYQFTMTKGSECYILEKGHEDEFWDYLWDAEVDNSYCMDKCLGNDEMYRNIDYYNEYGCGDSDGRYHSVFFHDVTVC